MASITQREAQQVEQANASGRSPVVFIHGLWLLPKRQQRNEGVTEIEKIPNRGHSLTIDSGWREVADKALAFVKRFA